MKHFETIDLTTKARKQRSFTERTKLEATVFNAYEVLEPEKLAWHVALYKAEGIGQGNEHEERGKVKDVFWDLRRLHKSSAVCH